MIKFIKNDYKMVTMALEYLVGRNIPFGIKLLYYVIVGAIALPFVPFMWIWYKITILRFDREFKKL